MCFDCRKACWRLVEVRGLCFQERKACWKFGESPFSLQKKACWLLYRFLESIFPMEVHVGGL